MPDPNNVRMLTRYKAWANALTYSVVSSLPQEESTRQRPTRFGSTVHTLNHVYVIDLIFKSHLLRRPHGFTSRNTPTHPPLEQLRDATAGLDAWYVQYAESMTTDDLDQTINFEFIGGGRGTMTRQEIILHVVNHGTYHRGFVGDMMYQAGVTPPATDLPVFLREVRQPY